MPPFRWRWSDIGTPAFPSGTANAAKSDGHPQAGSLAGAAHSRKNIWSNQWSAQAGQESAEEFKSKSWPDWILTTKES